MIMVNLREHREISGRHILVLPLFRFLAPLCACLAFLFSSQVAIADAVAARVASVKGAVTGSSESGNSVPLQRGSSVRSGTVISTAAESGALLRPAPKVNLVCYMTTKVRFDGTRLDSQGSGNVNCFLLSGRILLSFDSDSETREGRGKVEVSITTKEGVTLGRNGTWVVQQDDGRTVVAVSQGKVAVSIDNGAASAGVGGGQVEVTGGSVVWLQRREDGLVDRLVIDVDRGTVIRIGPDGTRDPSEKASPEMLKESRVLLSLSGDSMSTLSATSGSSLSTRATNPDLSSPKSELPIVSADTP